MNEKIKKTKKKLVKVKDEIDLQKSMYSDCFENEKSSAVVKGKERQSEWHQIAINDLLQVSQEIESFLTKLESAKKSCTVLGTELGQSDQTRRSTDENDKMQEKMKLKRKKDTTKDPFRF